MLSLSLWVKALHHIVGTCGWVWLCAEGWPLPGFELHGLSKFSWVYWDLGMLDDGSGEDMGCPKVSIEQLLTPSTR